MDSVDYMIKSRKLTNIAHLHWGFPPIIGGVETHLTVMLPEMARRKYKVSLLTCSAEGAKARDNFKGVKIFREPVMDLNWLFKRGLHGIEAETRKVLKSFIDQVKPDVLHAHNMHYFSKPHTYSLMDIAKSKGIPVFLTAHNVWDDILFMELARDVSWTHIIAVSHYIRQELIGVGCSHKNITTIHHGIDQRVYHPNVNPERLYKKYPQLRNRQVVFHPARMGISKGCDVGIKALPLIRKKFPNVILVLAGTKNVIDWGGVHQKDIAYMIELVDYFKMRNNVLIDTYSLSDMPSLYAISDVCIYPSTASEPFGLTMLEAMASARPIIVTNAGGMPEIIRDGINGFVVRIKDFEALASRVTQLLLDEQLCERLGTTGRFLVDQMYTKEIMTGNVLNLYRKYS